MSNRYSDPMPKNSSISILERWRAMDAALGRPNNAGWVYGLNVDSFALTWGVSTKTIRRDLAAFKAMGRRTVCKRVDKEVDIYRWYYEAGVEPLFVCNLLGPPSR